MKMLTLILGLMVITCASAQDVTNLPTIQADEEYENIKVQKLDTDVNSTSFVIWIRKGVKSHKHETHSEIIQVIEGTGVMTVEKNAFDIKPGDYFRIPQNTFHSLKVTSKKPMKVLSVQSPEFLGKDRVFEENTKK